MSTGIFSIGITGMQAAQMGLLTTEHNISNSTTAGYSRQRTVQATNIALMTGAGALGQGTHVQTVQRMYSEFLNGQVLTSQTNVSELESYSANITQIDNMLADANAGLSPALQDFFSAVQKVGNSPSSLPARQSMVSAAQTLSSRFQSLDSRLSEMSANVNDQIVADVGAINTLSQQVADINGRIIATQSAYNQPPNDLLDQRDQLINELNKLIKVSTNVNTDGSLNVFFGTGQPLVVGPSVTDLKAVASTSDPSRVVVGMTIGATVQELPEHLITGGDLGGLVRFRKESLDPAINQLGQVAASVALTFNAQHALGQDLLNNVTGNPSFVDDFFTLSGPKVIPDSNNAAGSNATATFVAPTAPTAPGYNGNFYTNLTASDYQLQFTSVVAGVNQYQLTRLSDGQKWNGDLTTINGVANGQGFNINVASASVGDIFTIRPTVDAAKNIGVDSRIQADVRLLAAAAPVKTVATATNKGSMAISQGVMGSGYSRANLPINIVAGAGVLNGFPGGSTVTAVYADGSSVSSTGTVNMSNAGSQLMSVTFDGMRFDITGTPTAGDTFAIQNNTGGVEDGRNVLLLAKLQTQKTVSGGTTSYQGSYAQLVSNNGIKTNEINVAAKAQQTLLQQSQQARDGLSGVNLDEEAANLLRYQQSYQAAAKMLDIGAKLFDTILSLRS